MNIKAIINGIITKACDDIVKALAKVPPSEWSKLSGSSARSARTARSSKSEDSGAKGHKRGGKVKKLKREVAAPKRTKKSVTRRDVNSLRYSIVLYVRSNEAAIGVAAGEIAASMKLDPPSITFALNSLRSAGFLRMEGLRGKARWFATDLGRRAEAADITAHFAPKGGRGAPAPSNEPSTSDSVAG